jgi:hypothetical protein
MRNLVAKQKRGADSRETKTRDWKLPIIMLPRIKQSFDLARLNNPLHRAIRRRLIEVEGARCSACRTEPDKGKLDAHEIFEFDERRHIKRFVAYRLLCEKCHYLTHKGYWPFTLLWRYLYQDDRNLEEWAAELKQNPNANQENVKSVEHFCLVNNCTPHEAYEYACSAMEQQRKLERIKHWHTDWSLLEQYRGLLNTRNIALLEKMLEQERGRNNNDSN